MLLVPGTADAGGWTQPKGEYYLKVWDRTLVGTRAYLSTGLRDTQRGLPRYQDHQLNVYFEYGIIDQLTLVAVATPVGWASMAGNSTAYIGPIVAGLRWGFFQKKVKLALEGHYGYAPGVGDGLLFDMTFPQGGGVQERIIYKAAIENHRGELQFQLGHGFSFGSWITAHVGVRFNSNDTIDTALTGFVQYGHKFKRPWVLEGHITVREPFGDVVLTNIPGVGQTRYMGVGLSPSYWFTEHVAIMVGVDGVFYASSNAATPSIMLGVEVK